MKTDPFFDPTPLPGAAPAARPTRRPYHDNTDCAEGQRVQQGGHWQPYEPTSTAETRPRCPVCRILDAPSR